MQAESPKVSRDPILPEVQMQLAPPTQPVTGKVVENVPCLNGKSSSFIRHISIDVTGTPLEGNFRAGQAFGIVPPGIDARGRSEKVRLYSISSPSRGEDGEGKVLSTTCKRALEELDLPGEEDSTLEHQLFTGKCSNYLCNLQVGDEVQVTGPAGKRFLIPQDPEQHDYLFLATGTGIAPFRGMLMDLLDSPASPVSSEIHLVMGAPYTTDLLYHDYFVQLARRHPNFHYHTVVSREIQPDGTKGGYIHHYLDRQIQLHEQLLKQDRTLMYMCGLAGMQLGVFKMLAARGLGDPFIKIKDDYLDVEPADWDSKSIRRNVRPTHRCMLEVY
ncbi:MAG: hypothetical protein CBC35_03750 [Planctomycetes bacterium TMED75]|nr:hypothetical protein [Planctomycetaceae bacterium]OUU94604.1 MAG: hypothetical protein CBC35_03750 [Planctomycetes bacterium TMED75]